MEQHHLRTRPLTRWNAGPLRTAVTVGLALFVIACEQSTPTGLLGAGARASLTADINVLVGFTSAPGPQQTALIEGFGGRVTHQYRNFPIVAATIPEVNRAALAATAGVAYVDLDAPRQLFGGKQKMDYGVSKIEAPGAWQLGFRGAGVKVGIFDTGIDLDHPDLVVAGGVDLIGDGNGLDDCHGHGTHVAGIVGARNNGHHTVGVAPAAQLYAMRFFDCVGGGATLARELMGIDWAIDNGMDVINMSFGGVIEGLVADPTPTPSEEAAMAAAYASGIVLIAASGNSSTPYVSYPAGYSTVVAVGATDADDLLASFSQYGTDQELTAPGVANLSSYLVGGGISTSLTVDTDADRELDAIPMEFSGTTRKQGLRAGAVYAGLGTALDYGSIACAGRIAVVMRGGTTFAEKTVAAMDAGCAAIVIHNHSPGTFNGTLGTAMAPDGRAWIPAVSITLDEGLYLKDQIQSRPTTLTLTNAAGNLAVLSGTSMASPHATGVAALVLSRNPTLSPDQVRQVMRASAEDLGTPGWDPVFGYGRINARRAVQQAQ